MVQNVSEKFSDGRIHAFSDSCHFSANSTSWQMLGFLKMLIPVLESAKTSGVVLWYK